MSVVGGGGDCLSVLNFVSIDKSLRFFSFERTLLKISRFLNLLTSLRPPGLRGPL